MRALVRFVPDCLVLFRRLAADPRVPRRRKLLLAALAGYLVFPLDLIPDFLPVIGQLDDAFVIARQPEHGAQARVRPRPVLAQ